MNALISFKNGLYVASASSSDQTVKIWNIKDGSLVKTIITNSSSIGQILELPDGNLAAALNGTINIYKM